MGDEIELNATTKAQDTLPVFWWIKRSKSNKKEEKQNAKLQNDCYLQSERRHRQNDHNGQFRCRACTTRQEGTLVDADPQGDLTTCLGWRDNDSLTTTITDKLSGVIREDYTDPRSGILHHEENVDLLPANIELSAMEMMLVTAMSRETILRSYLSKVKDNYDYVLIDCMPSLGMVTLNALAAADSVIIPVQAQYLPAKGMTQLMQTIGKVRQYINPSLRIDGILLNIVDNRTNLAKSTADALRKNFGSVIKIYRSSIPMAVKAAEVASKGVSIYKYEPSSPVAKAYAEFAKEVSADGRKKERLHSADAR